jgi:hypothetical protein
MGAFLESFKPNYFILLFYNYFLFLLNFFNNYLPPFLNN